MLQQKDNAGDEKYLEVSEVFQFETPELFSFMVNREYNKVYFCTIGICMTHFLSSGK